MADAPDYIVLRRHRDLEGRSSVWWRRSFQLLVTALLVAGLANVFGQRPNGATAAGPAATMTLYAPKALRGGLLWTARIRITAHRDLKDATLVLSPGWMESMQINSLEPSPVGEASRDGWPALELGHIAAGSSYLFFMDFQVNATNVGRRNQDLRLDDGKTPLLTIHRTITIFP